jgi:hypothetical protein
MWSKRWKPSDTKASSPDIRPLGGLSLTEEKWLEKRAQPTGLTLVDEDK